jgi:transcriptional regulator with XRE-family HTH domain
MEGVQKMSELSINIRLRREQLGYTQEELARLIGGSQKQIWRYESGTGEPSLNTLKQIAYVLHTSADWLLGLTDDSGTHNPDLNDKEMQLLNLYRNKSPEMQQKLIDIARVV